MPDNDTLLAYLVPKLTNEVEDAATEALAYILNKSAASKGALAGLVGVDRAGLVRVSTQELADDQSRPDLVCFDASNEKRIIVEAKFWAGLTDNQPGSYIQQLPESGRSTLLFIAPDVRINTLWATIKAKAGKGGIQLEPVDSPARVPTAKVSGTERHLMPVSWDNLLGGMLVVAEDADIRAEIAQLHGLAQSQDKDAFLPLHSEELAPAFARRMRGFMRLIDDAIHARGIPEGWMDAGSRATPQWYGYGRYFRFSGENVDWWFGINHDQWATSGDTPLWLVAGPINLAIYPQTGVEYDAILDDVARQLRAFGAEIRRAMETYGIETENKAVSEGSSEKPPPLPPDVFKEGWGAKWPK